MKGCEATVSQPRRGTASRKPLDRHQVRDEVRWAKEITPARGTTLTSRWRSRSACSPPQHPVPERHRPYPAAAASGAGMAPSCCSIRSVSQLLQVSATGDTGGLEDALTVDHVVHEAQNPFAASQHGLEVLRGQVRMYRGVPGLVMTVDAQ
jgi:hypothetical protein